MSTAPNPIENRVDGGVVVSSTTSEIATSTSRFYRLAVLVLLAMFVLYLLPAIFTRYSADDYCYVNAVTASGIFQAANAYNTWAGEITSQTLLGLIEQPQPSGLWSVLVLAGWLLFVYSIVRRFVATRSAYIALLLLITTLDSAPALWQSVYWNPGLVKYGLGIMMISALIAWILWQPEKRFAVIGAALLSVLTANLSTFMAPFLPGLLLLAWFAFQGERRKLAGALVGGVVGLVIVLIAPGNALRAATFPPHNVLSSAVEALIIIGLPLLDSVRFATVGILALVMLPLLINSTMVRRNSSAISGRTAILRVIGVLGAIGFGAQFIALYPTGNPLIERAALIPMGLFILGVAVLAAYWPQPSWLSSRAIIGSAFGIFVAVSVFRAGQTTADAMAYSRAWDSRDAAIKAGDWKQVRAIMFPTQGLEDIGSNWANNCIRAYYKTTVILPVGQIQNF